MWTSLALIAALLAAPAATATATASLLRAAATGDCVAPGATAPTWDAVTPCKGWYALLTNGNARVAEDPTASVVLSKTSGAVTSVEDCATSCFKAKKCQWFKVDATAGARKTCTHYQHLALSEARRGRGDAEATALFGFLLSGDPDFLNQNVKDPSTSVFQLGGHSFYVTKDLATNKAISMYIPSKTAQCAAPLTLYRAYANNYQTASMASKAASGETINAMDDKFTLETFLGALRAEKPTEIEVPTDAVDINAKGNVVRAGKGSTFTYRLDRFGRVTGASAHVGFNNVLRKPGRPGANSAGASIRSQYCNNAYQQRFNVVQQLSEANKADLSFQAGHLMACQFTNPHGFFNFVPQSVNSNARNGCWYNTELGTSRLLKMGCEGDFQSRLTYFSRPGDLTEVSKHTGPLLTASEAAEIYTTAGNDDKLLVQRPCGFFYRPLKMSLDFTITSAVPGSRCSIPQEALRANQGKFFSTNGRLDSMQITRSFAHWTFESPSFNRIRGMAAADWRANQCYAETGALVSQITFDNGFDRVLLKLKAMNATSSTAFSCLAAGADGVMSLGDCDAEKPSFRWSGQATTGAMTSTSVAHCVTVADSRECVEPTFEYIKRAVSFDGSKADIKSGDELVDGYVLVGTSCIVVSGKRLTLKSAATGTTSCSIFQSTYSLDDSSIDDGDE